jgi:hypothetical protein
MDKKELHKLGVLRIHPKPIEGTTKNISAQR